MFGSCIAMGHSVWQLIGSCISISGQSSAAGWRLASLLVSTSRSKKQSLAPLLLTTYKLLCSSAFVCAQESMRLQPVAATPLTRVATRDLRLSDGTVIPAGVTVEAAQYTPMRDERWGWHRGSDFIPVRLPLLPE